MPKLTITQIFWLLYLGAVALAALFGWSQRALAFTICDSRGECHILPWNEDKYPGYYCGDHDCQITIQPNIGQITTPAARLSFDHARNTECSSALQRDAMAEYDTIAEMIGIPAGAPIYTLERKQYVAAVCLHESLRSR